MKIVIIVSEYLPVPPFKGGAVENLIYNYITNDEKKLFIVYSCDPHKEFENKNKNIEYRFIDTNKKLFIMLNTVFKVVNKIFCKKIGNYYTHLIKKDLKKKKDNYNYLLIENNPAYVLYFRKIAINKIILHVHNDWLNKESKNSKIIKNSCKSIYVVSEYVHQKVKEIDDKDNNVKLLMNGIDEKRFYKSNKNNVNYIKKKFGIKKEDTILLFTGKLNEQKGANLLLEAFTKFSKDHNDIKLLLVGSSFNLDSNDSPLIKEMKNNAKSNSNIIFTGFINYNDIQDYYSIADIQIVPSQIEDSCPLVVLEGLHSGNAFIVSDSGGIPELINNKCAIIIKRNKNFVEELYKSIEKLYNNKELIEKMKKEAKKQSKKFMNKNYIDSFSNLLDNE